MPSFGPASEKRLKTCHPDIQTVLHEAIRYVDFSVLCGHRTFEEQAEAYRQGRSQLDGKFKKSKHQSMPSIAVDVMPWPGVLHGVSVWQDETRYSHVIGIIMGVALVHGVQFRWGGDWDGDTSLKNHRFIDMPHLELKT